MYISKAKQYAISRAIFNIEQAVRADNNDQRWDMYAVLRELGIDHMFHEMPESVQNKGGDLFFKARYYPHQLREA
jgi:hypothetical protein